MTAAPVGSSRLAALAWALAEAGPAGRAGAPTIALLADTSGLPRIASLWPRLSALVHASLMPTGAAQPDGATPLLFDVGNIATRPATRRAVDELDAHGRWANALSLIAAPRPFADLVEALTDRTVAELPDRLEVRLRYFDTRTLPLLPRLLTEPQYADFHAGIDAWHYLDRHGRLQALPRPRAAASAGRAYPRLVLDPAQERMLIDDGTTDAVVDLLLDHRHPAFDGLTPPEQHDAVAPLVQAAAGWTIESLPDVARFCFQALAIGPAFDRDPRWSDRLERFRTGRMSLAEALDAEP